MVSLRPLFNSNMFSLFIVLVSHFGCFSSRNHDGNDVSISLIKKKLITSPKKRVISFFKALITPSSSSSSSNSISQPLRVAIPSPSSSTRSLRSNPPTITTPSQDTKNPTKPNNNGRSFAGDVILHPCPTCGEVFPSPSLLRLHQHAKHAISELVDGENIIRIIFKMGWPEKIAPAIHRILKIHNSPRIVSRFEEYRELVKSTAAKTTSSSSHNRERCIADGNELLRFHCTTYACGLSSSVCARQQYCGVCGIVRSGFSPKADGISMLSTSWKAHVAVPEELEAEFGLMGVRRASLLCRVVAGRVGFDSDLVGRFDEDELVVVNPRAVLPCFVIVYTV